METINEIQDEIVEEFSSLTDWMDKYQMLIDLGNDQKPIDPKYKIEQNLIDGCQSRVWLQADYVDGKIVFQAESDALITKGLVELIVRVFSGHTPDEILKSTVLEKVKIREPLYISALKYSGADLKRFDNVTDISNILSEETRMNLQNWIDSYNGKKQEISQKEILKLENIDFSY